MSVDLVPRGTLTEEELRALEAGLGRPLPADYRTWLGATNGARFPNASWIPEHEIWAEETLWGYQTDRVDTDLIEGDRRTRDVLTDDFVAITRTLSGYLAVKVRGGDIGSVWEFDMDSVAGAEQYDPRYISEHLLVRIADDFDGFLGMWEIDESSPFAHADD